MLHNFKLQDAVVSLLAIVALAVNAYNTFFLLAGVKGSST